MEDLLIARRNTTLGMRVKIRTKSKGENLSCRDFHMRILSKGFNVKHKTTINSLNNGSRTCAP